MHKLLASLNVSFDADNTSSPITPASGGTLSGRHLRLSTVRLPCRAQLIEWLCHRWPGVFQPDSPSYAPARWNRDGSTRGSRNCLAYALGHPSSGWRTLETSTPPRLESALVGAGLAARQADEPVGETAASSSCRCLCRAGPTPRRRPFQLPLLSLGPGRSLVTQARHVGGETDRHGRGGHRVAVEHATAPVRHRLRRPVLVRPPATLSAGWSSLW